MRNVLMRLKKQVFTVVVAAGMLVLAGPAHSRGLDYEQAIELRGTANTRDIGGYVNEDLRAIRMGQIIRSDKLSRLTASDFEKLEAMGLKTVIDLRTDEERKQSPTVWQGDHPPQFHHLPVFDADHKWYRAQSRMLNKTRLTA